MRPPRKRFEFPRERRIIRAVGVSVACTGAVDSLVTRSRSPTDASSRPRQECDPARRVQSSGLHPLARGRTRRLRGRRSLRVDARQSRPRVDEERVLELHRQRHRRVAAPGVALPDRDRSTGLVRLVDGDACRGRRDGVRPGHAEQRLRTRASTTGACAGGTTSASATRARTGSRSRAIASTASPTSRSSRSTPPTATPSGRAASSPTSNTSSTSRRRSPATGSSLRPSASRRAAAARCTRSTVARAGRSGGSTRSRTRGATRSRPAAAARGTHRASTGTTSSGASRTRLRGAERASGRTAAAYPGPVLYTDSLVVTDAKTGTLRWHDQVTPHDIRDYDFHLPPILGDVDGEPAVFGAGKAGVVIAWNRESHRRLWERRVGLHQNDSGPAAAKPVTIFPGDFGGVETPMALAENRLFVPWRIDFPARASATGLSGREQQFQQQLRDRPRRLHRRQRRRRRGAVAEAAAGDGLRRSDRRERRRLHEHLRRHGLRLRHPDRPHALDDPGARRHQRLPRHRRRHAARRRRHRPRGGRSVAFATRR